MMASLIMPWEFVTERHLSAQNWKSFLFFPPVKILAWQASSPPLRVIHCPIHQKGEQPLSPQGDQHSPSHCCRPRQTCRSDAARFGTLYFSFLEIFQFLPFQQQKCNPPWSLVWKECRRPRARSPWKESCRMRFVFHNPLFITKFELTISFALQGEQVYNTLKQQEEMRISGKSARQMVMQVRSWQMTEML